ncbi:MAG: GFA family protein [Pseudomonadales bacterium]|nr:GFA family protein [Pseudomonadales bacterium]
MKIPLEGACQCGNVTYALNDNPVMTYACHCSDCQKRTGSAFSMGMIISANSIAIKGALSSWARTSDSGNINTRYSCKSCGNIIYGVGSFTPEVFKLQPGTLDDTSDVSPEVHLWTVSAQPWVSFSGGAPKFDRQPDDPGKILAVATKYRESKNH